jgi:xanthine dehydrogenase accessory factor
MLASESAIFKRTSFSSPASDGAQCPNQSGGDPINMLSIWQAAVEQFRKGENFALAAILSVRGSSPRHVGTRFLVRQDGSIVGTIGGGLLEASVQRIATSALQSGTSHRASFSFTGRDAAQSTDMICGGEADVLVEFVNSADQVTKEIVSRLEHISREKKSGYLFTSVSVPEDGEDSKSVKHLLIDDSGTRIGGFSGDETALKAMPQSRLLKPSQLLDVAGLEHPVFLEWLHPTGTAYIFGAGHVGACVAHLAAYVDFKVVAVDDRAEFANVERIPSADEVVVVDSFPNCLAEFPIDEDSYLVIVTRGHAHDKTVLAQALKTRAGYIGMIGSRRKTNLVYQALLAEGFTQEDLQRVHSPIGLPIGGETPEEIGISIIAEMIQIRNRKERLRDLNV